MPFFPCDEYELFYREEGSGPPLLILPGNTASSACHQAELEHFGQSFRCLSLDFLGTGQSPRQSEWPDDWWARAAHDGVRLLDHLGIGRSLVMGTSGGGVIALLMAIHHGTRVAGVVADSCVERWLPQRLREEVEQRGEAGPELEGFWQFAHGDDWRQVVDADSHLLLRLADVGGRWFHGRLGEIVDPVLFTVSLNDELLPDVEQQILSMTRQIAGSEAVFVNGGGHPLMWTSPDEFRRAAGCFLLAHAP